MIECIFCLILEWNLANKINVQIATPVDIIMGEIASVEDGIVKLNTEADEAVYVNIAQIVGVDLTVAYQSADPEELILKSFIDVIKKECCCQSDCCYSITKLCSKCCSDSCYSSSCYPSYPSNNIARLLIQLAEYSQQNQMLLFSLFDVQIMLPAENLVLSSNELSFYYTLETGDESAMEILSLVVNEAVSDITLVNDGEDDSPSMISVFVPLDRD